MNKESKLILIDSLEKFKSLEHEWNQLYKESSRSTITSTWDWMFTWWEVYQYQYTRELFILAYYSDNKLVGLAPFQIDKSYPKSLIQGKTLRFIGTGSATEDTVVSEFIDLIVSPEFEEDFTNKVSNYLIENKRKWNFANFNFLLEDSLIHKCFNKNTTTEISNSSTEYGNRFSISGHESYQDYLEKMGSRWKKTLIKKKKKLLNSGEMTIETTDSPESIDFYLDQLADMNKSRWTDRSKFHIFDSTYFYEFHRKILKRLQPQNKAYIKTLSLDGEALACFYAFEDKGTIHYYQSGFYKKYANRYSPLFLLISSEIEDAINNNKVFDFMFDENPSSYKKEQYAASTKPMYKIHCSHQAYRLHTFNKIKKLKDTVVSANCEMKRVIVHYCL